MAERSVKVIISAVDRLTAPLNKINNALKPMEASVKRVNNSMQGTAEASRRVTGAVQGTTSATRKLSGQLSRTATEAGKAVGKMGAFAAANDNLRFKLTRTAAAASVALGAMGAYSAAVDKADRSTRRFNTDRLMSGLRGLGTHAQRAGRHLADLARQAGTLGAVSAVGAAAGVAWLGKQVVDTSSTFERMAITLETVMGDKGKAKEALKWVSDFAQKTPFELKETSEAFVKLKSYGIDPMKGALTAAGNAAAIMGKPLNQAVEAMADAMTGENERLKEFGITAHIEGNKIQYNWTENGKAMTAFAKKNSRDQMLAVINGIWNRQYAGGMDKLSSTWAGMLSNMSDAWTRITQQIGEAGLFDFLKENLKQVLDYVTMLQDTGKLKEWATGISRAATDMLRKFKAFVTEIKWDEVGNKLLRILSAVETISNVVGGPLNLALLTMGAFTFGPLISSFTLLTVTLLPLLIKLLPRLATGFRVLTVAMATNPFLLITTALLGLVAAAIYVGRNWDYFGKRLDRIMGGISKSFSRAWQRIKDAYGGFGTDLMSWVTGLLGRFTDFWNKQWSEISTNTQNEFQSIIDWLTNFDMVSVGKDLVQRMWDGMKNRWDDMKKWFMKKVKSLFNFWGSKGDDDSDGSSTGGGGSSGRSGGGGGSSAGSGVGRSKRGGIFSRSRYGGAGTTSPEGAALGGSAKLPDGTDAEERLKAIAAAPMDPMSPKGSGLAKDVTTIASPSGRRFTVKSEFAENFKGFITDYEKAGGVISGSSGGLSARPGNASYHPQGRAIDVNQVGYGIRSKGAGVLDDATEQKIAAKWGLYPGSRFKSRNDEGHFEVRNGDMAKQALERLKAGSTPLTPDQIRAAPTDAGHVGHRHGPNGEELGPETPVGGAMTKVRGTDLRGKGTTAGLNNNNYGNLKFNGQSTSRYPGVLGPSANRDQGDPQIVFKSLEDGIQGTVNLIKRFNGEGKDTVRKMVSDKGGWTPGNLAAAKNIADAAGVGLDDKIDPENKDVLKRVVKGIGKQEHGKAGESLHDTVDKVIDGPKKDEGPKGAGVAAAKAAGEEKAKASTAGATEYKPTIIMNGVADKDIPKKVEKVTSDHSRDMRQRQREALHD